MKGQNQRKNLVLDFKDLNKCYYQKENLYWED